MRFTGDGQRDKFPYAERRTAREGVLIVRAFYPRGLPLTMRAHLNTVMHQ
jgi:hypothetical protein